MQGILFVDLYYMIIDKLQFVYVLAYQDLLAALKTEDKLSMYSMHRQRRILDINVINFFKFCWDCHSPGRS